MKTRIRRLLSLALAVIMTVSCCFSAAFSVSAYDITVAEPYYDLNFDDGVDPIVQKYSSYSHYTSEIVADSETDKALEISITGNNNIVLPVKLEADKTYKYSFEYKITGYSKKDETKNYQVALYLKSGEKNGYPGSNLATIWNYQTFTGAMSDYESISGTITTDSTNITSKANLLSLQFVKGSYVGDFVVNIDNLKVEEVGGTVVFNTNGGNTISSVTGYRGQEVELPVPTKSYATFNGWYLGAEYINKVESVTVPAKGETVTLYAAWEQTTSLNFDDGVDPIVGVYSSYSNYTSEIVADSETDKAFSIGITNDNNNLVLPIRLDADKTYKYSFDYKITGYSKKDESKNYQISLNLKSSEKNGYPGSDLATVWNYKTFTGAMSDYESISGTFTTNSTTVTSKANLLSLRFIKGSNVGDFVVSIDNLKVEEVGGTVAFNTNGGNTISSVTGYPGKTVELPTPTKIGAKFLGWYTDAELTNAAESIVVPASGNTVTIYAGWDINTILDFDDGANPIVGVYSSYSNYTSEIVADSETDKAFSIGITNDNNNIVLPITLEAGKTYNYSFEYKITGFSKKDETKNYQVSLNLKSSEKNGYPGSDLVNVWNYKTCTGAMSDYESVSGTFTTNSTTVTNKANLVSLRFIRGAYVGDFVVNIDNFRVEEVGGTVAFNTNGGKAISSVTGYPSKSVVLPTPTKTGYKFLGWYLDEDLTRIAENVKVPAVGETVTVYADWELITKIDFEDGKESILAKYAAYTNYTSSVIADGDNNSLNLNITGKSVVTFPIRLEAGKTYKYSFDYKLTSLEKKDENVAFQINMEIDAAESNGYPGYPTKQVALPWSWKEFDSIMGSYATQRGTFTVGDEMSGYFAFNFILADNNASTGLNLDNISVIEMPKPATPVAPTIVSVEGNTVTLNTVAGCEYRLNGGAWQSSPVFKGMLQGAELNFTQRVKATSDALASEESAVTIHTIALSGDANNDGVINAYDLVLSRKFLFNGNVDEFSIDANADGFVDITDLVNLKKYLLNVAESTVMVIDNIDVKGFKVYSDSAVITTQARDELIEVINAREEGLVEAVDEIGDNKNVITLAVDFEMTETEYILTVKNGTIEIKAGSDYALLDAVRLFASVLNNNVDESLIRLENGYTIAGEHIGLAYEGAIQKKNI